MGAKELPKTNYCAVLDATGSCLCGTPCFQVLVGLPDWRACPSPQTLLVGGGGGLSRVPGMQSLGAMAETPYPCAKHRGQVPLQIPISGGWTD